MATPNLILPKPFALIQPLGSELDGYAIGTGLNFGMIMLIYQTCDAYEGGDSVSYNPNGQTLVNYDGIEYALVREENILNKEIADPAP